MDSHQFIQFSLLDDNAVLRGDTPKRPRGRPFTGCALSRAERQRIYMEKKRGDAPKRPRGRPRVRSSFIELRSQIISKDSLLIHKDTEIMNLHSYYSDLLIRYFSFLDADSQLSLLDCT